MAYNETLLTKEIEMFKKNETVNVAAALQLGHVMIIRKKKYQVVVKDIFQDGNLGFTFQNVKDSQDYLCVTDVPPMTLVTIQISREELTQQIINSLCVE